MSNMKKSKKAYIPSMVAALMLVIFTMIMILNIPVYAASVTGNINWASATGRTADNYSFGLNLFKMNESASDQLYKENVSWMTPGIVRYHRWDLCQDSTMENGWVDNASSSNYAWNVNKIHTALDGTAFTNNPERMMNIPNWPPYMEDSTGKLKTDMYDAYASFCASLVQIVNKDLQGHYTKYWEISNEVDDLYESDMAALATIIKKCITAMKAVDPTIKVGGPAFERPDLIDTRVKPFIANCYNEIDFISYHTYSSGSTGDSNQSIWNDASGLGDTTTAIKNAIAFYTTRNIETFHDEFNISWNPPDSRMNNEIGMIYDGLSLISIVNAGATGSMAWNECDGWYGKLNWDAAKRPSAYLYNVFNNYMKGYVVSSSSSDSSKVAIMATKNGIKRQIALVNRSEASQTIQLTFSGWSSTPSSSSVINTYTVSSTGTATGTTTYGTLTGSGLSMASNTVVVLTYEDDGTPPPPEDENIAPNGTGYVWSKNTSATANTNRVAASGINDGNLTGNVELNGGSNDNANAWEAAGVVWSSAQSAISKVEFINGSYHTSYDGVFSANFKLQFSTNGTAWTDSNWTCTPSYSYNSSVAAGTTYTFTGSSVSNIKGVRVVGQVHTGSGTYDSWHAHAYEVLVYGEGGTTPPPPPPSGILGSDAEPTGYDSWCADYINCNRHTAPSDMTLTTMKVNINASSGGKMKLAIYSDNNNAPGAFLMGTEERTSVGTGWQTFNLTSSLNVTAGTNYWLALFTDDDYYRINCTTGSSGVLWYKGVTYGGWPSTMPLPASGTSNKIFCFYAQ